jgi:hypothetical protein
LAIRFADDATTMRGIVLIYQAQQLGCLQQTRKGIRVTVTQLMIQLTMQLAIQ